MKKIILTAAIICGTVATAFAGHFGPRPEPPRHHKPAVHHHRPAKPVVKPAPKAPPKGPAKPAVKPHHHKENHHRR